MGSISQSVTYFFLTSCDSSSVTKSQLSCQSILFSCCCFQVWPSFEKCLESLFKSPVWKKKGKHVNWLIFLNYWLLGSFHSENGLLVLFLSQIPQWRQVHKQKEKSMDFLWQLWERCLASQSVCLRWTSQSVLWCCSIALFTSASCSKPIWSEAHRALTTISTSVNSLLGPSHSIWPSKWLLYSAEHLYIPVWVF